MLYHREKHVTISWNKINIIIVTLIEGFVFTEAGNNN